jgi:hypothetical protein
MQAIASSKTENRTGIRASAALPGLVETCSRSAAPSKEPPTLAVFAVKQHRLPPRSQVAVPKGSV